MSTLDLTVLLLGAAILASALGSVFWSRSALAGGELGLRRIQSENAVLARDLKNVEKLRPEAEQVAMVMRRNRALDPEAALLAVVTELPSDVRFTRAGLDYGGEQVSVALDVVARGPLAYERFLNALRRSPTVTGVVPGPEEHAQETRAQVRVLLESAAKTP